MDKILSARLDEQVIVELERATRKTGITKKRFLEDAIREHARQVNAQAESDVWSETFGLWKRKESAASTVNRVRSIFRKSLERHKR
jgi:hypothetical protein